MTHRTESFNKNIPHIEPAFERKYFKQSHHCITDVIKIKSFRISPETRYSINTTKEKRSISIALREREYELLIKNI